jgi:hypothetical protein
MPAWFLGGFPHTLDTGKINNAKVSRAGSFTMVDPC